jgi:hypothetical protein
MARIDIPLLLALLTISGSLAYADQGSFTNSGGSTSATPSITSNVATPPGTLNMDCPGANPTSCSGGAFTFHSTDGSTAISATFTGGSFVESCSGGGKGGHVSCGYSFTGYFSGTLTVNGSTQSINGVTHQGFGTGREQPGEQQSIIPLTHRSTTRIAGRFFVPTICWAQTKLLMARKAAALASSMAPMELHSIRPGESTLLTLTIAGSSALTT